MNVFLLNPAQVTPENHLQEGHLHAYLQILRDAERDVRGNHALVTTAEEAELVLAPIAKGGYGPTFAHLRKWPQLSENLSRLLVYSEEDNPYPVFPGLYPACKRLWKKVSWAAPAHYRLSNIFDFNIEKAELNKKDILFSFVGTGRSDPVRARVLALSDSEACLVDVSSGEDLWWNCSHEAQLSIRQRYRDVMVRSKFVVCPRGYAPSSMRLFEALEAGAVPVILSDRLLLPEGPDWERFAVRLPERAVSQLPAVVRNFEPHSKLMGELARAAWEEYFSPTASFNSLVNWAGPILARSSSFSFRTARAVAWAGRFTTFPDRLRAQARRLKKGLENTWKKDIEQA
jgi:hypothetical protein